MQREILKETGIDTKKLERPLDPEEVRKKEIEAKNEEERLKHMYIPPHKRTTISTVKKRFKGPNLSQIHRYELNPP
jgi:hypothetical protein